jgi:hypothetical protein
MQKITVIDPSQLAVLGCVPPCRTLTAAVLKDLGFGGGPKRGPQASRTPHTRPPGSEKGLNKFKIREVMNSVCTWLLIYGQLRSVGTRTSWRINYGMT